MALSLGIVGLPNVGKSTLFQALTKKEVEIANYPFATIDPNVGVVQVPDERIEKLAQLFSSKKVIPTVVEFVDIAGLVRGANKGEGLGNKFLSHIRDVDAIVHVVRCFEKSDIIHVENEVNPERDIDTVNTELMLKDLETIEHRLESIEKEVRAQKKGAVEEAQILKEIQSSLNKGTSVFQYLKENPKAREHVKDLQFLGAKPMMYLFNADKDNVDLRLIKKIEELGSSFVIMNIKEEFESISLSSEEVRELGVELKLKELIKKSYEILDLITFLTTGEDETRAWTIKRGAMAPQAGGVIHSDFEQKFIRAQAISTEKLLEAGGYIQAAAKGWLRTEGKEYVVQDGDVIEIKHG